MKYFSVLYLSLIREYSEKDAERPYASEWGMQKIRVEQSQLLRAQLMSKAKS